MLGYIKGKVLHSSDGTVLLENNGIGYEVLCSGAAYAKLISDGQGEVYTYLQVREDGVSLFGFVSPEEKNMFLKLISVSGVGPKMGITVLSSMNINDIAVAIANSDVKKLTAAKGLGKKTAERIILELREKVSAESLPEKGAAVAAAGYLREAHPELSGFSPRNLRRMRAFYQTYGNHPDLLELAMRIGWTLNALILEVDLTLEERTWYLNAALRFGWTKTTLKEKLEESAHLNEKEKVEGMGNEDLSTSQPEDSDPHKDRPGAPAYRVAPRHTKLSQLAMSCGFMEKRIFSSHGPVDPFP